MAVQTLLMLLTTIVYPPFQNPDETAQVDYVMAHLQGQWFDGPGQRPIQSGVQDATAKVPDLQFHTHVGNIPVVPRSDRRSFDALGTAPSTSPIPNQMVQHPPLYYGLAAGWTYVLPGWQHSRFDVQVFWLRLLSVLLMVPIPLLIYGSARRLTLPPAVGLTAALLPLSIPSYLRTGASVTNDSLLALLLTVLLALLVRVACGDLTRRTAALVGLAWGGALMTKGFALALPPAIVLAYLVGTAGRRGSSWVRRVRAALPGLVVAGLVGGGIGLWWWVRNVVVYGTVQPDGLGPVTPAVRQQILGVDHPGGTELGFFANFFRLLSRRVWGSIGLIDDPSPPVILLYALSAALLALLTVSFVVARRRWHDRATLRGLGGWSVGRAATLALPAVAVLAVMYAGSRTTYLRGGQLPGIQVRYVVPLFLGLSICGAVALSAIVGRFARWLPVSVVALALAYTGAWMAIVLAVDFSPPGDTGRQALTDGISFVTDWAPFPRWVTAGLAALTVLVGVATLVATARFGSASGRTESAHGGRRGSATRPAPANKVTT